MPAGVYIGMEDEPYSYSDLDYDDDTFVFTDVMVTPSLSSAVPEPTSTILSLAGIALIVTFAITTYLCLAGTTSGSG
jgi:hypothetical protein